MVVEVPLNDRHAPSIPCAFEHEAVGRAEEDQHGEDSDGGHDQRVEQPRLVAHWGAVAIAGSGAADHREIDAVEAADVPVDIVAYAASHDIGSAPSRERECEYV